MVFIGFLLKTLAFNGFHWFFIENIGFSIVFFGFLRAYVISVCIFASIDIIYNHKKWPINLDHSYSFPYVQKGSNYLIKEFPNEKDYQNTKEKVQDL